MAIHIKFIGEVDGTDSFEINELATLLEQEGSIPIHIIKDEIRPHIKDGGLSIAIDILNLSVATISTVISIVTYWQSQKRKYSISVSWDDITLSLENLSNHQLKELIKKLETSEGKTTIDIVKKDRNMLKP